MINVNMWGSTSEIRAEAAAVARSESVSDFFVGSSLLNTTKDVLHKYNNCVRRFEAASKGSTKADGRLGFFMSIVHVRVSE